MPYWLDRQREALDPDSQSRLSTVPAHSGFQNKDTQALLEDAPTLANALCDKPRRFEEVQAWPGALGIPFQAKSIWCVVWTITATRPLDHQ